MSWRCLLQGVVVAIHDEQIAEHGGSSGVRDEGFLSSALARPQHRATYGEPSIFDLAAAYAFGIVRNHPFVDGNKRTGLLAAYVFLHSNGWELRATEADAVTAILALAADELSEPAFSTWLERNSAVRVGRQPS